ncbi:MAG: DUF393 domain-containing protein [Candidatus Eisenbacteria bacterium]|nr:DUF393 domain-containing protein [Candidatus Eisenbacteria bacterium]
MSARPEAAPILFYDGDCGLCARSVAWCLAHDRHATLRYAPLQGETYAALDVADRPRDLDTVVLLENGRLLTRSDALLRVLAIVGGPWFVLARLGSLAPRALLEASYRFVAKRRLGWFGTADSCRMPSADERALFLP